MTRALSQLLDAVLPTSCIDCKVLGSHHCDVCAARFKPTPHWVFREQLPGVAATYLDPSSASILRAVKDEGRTALIGKMLEAMLQIDLVLNDSRGQVPSQRATLSNALLSGQAVLVPIPYSRRAMRKRGFDAVEILTNRLSAKRQIEVHTGLRLARQPKDQRKLGVVDRRQNLSGAMRYRPPNFNNDVAIIVDDVVTTGATVLEAARAIEATGAKVAGFITFAETRRDQDAKSQK